MERWIAALPTETEQQRDRQSMLQAELEWVAVHLGDTPGIDGQSLVFCHCDLLSANVIIQVTAASASSDASDPPERSPQSSATSSPVTAASIASDRDPPPVTVSFIDYEYATPAPVAFDIANHFAEWGGFECDFSVLPTRSQRRNFLSTYLQAYNSFRGREYSSAELDQLMSEVDAFRGLPGIYWGIWALIQAQISQIEFDYANYAEIRLGEYFAWKESLEKETKGEAPLPLRERRWAQEK
jgi:ethanolamine kinase